MYMPSINKQVARYTAKPNSCCKRARDYMGRAYLRPIVKQGHALETLAIILNRGA